MKCFFLTAALLALACSQFSLVAATDNNPDTTAKYLAGLAVPAIAADSPMNNSTWAAHSSALDEAWKRFQERQLPAIANWAPQFLGPAYRTQGTLYYMFSGPDFLYAHAFFPNASTYILCGVEEIGPAPDLNAIAPEVLPSALANLRKSMESSLDWSFFITKNMKVDLKQRQLSGVLPILYVFLARSGCTIESVIPVSLNREGNMIESGKGETAGIRIIFSGNGSSTQTLYYFCSDLSDDGIKAHPGFMKFCEKQGSGVSLLKAASYLIHEGGFTRARDFLLRQSTTLIQDDSGIPLHFFEPNKWDIYFCGQYIGPIETFKQHYQPDLAQAYATNPHEPLPFGFGYQWQPSRSGLIIANRK
jgi:hypothetical protein